LHLCCSCEQQSRSATFQGGVAAWGRRSEMCVLSDISAIRCPRRPSSAVRGKGSAECREGLRCMLRNAPRCVGGGGRDGEQGRAGERCSVGRAFSVGGGAGGERGSVWVLWEDAVRMY